MLFSPQTASQNSIQGLAHQYAFVPDKSIIVSVFRPPVHRATTLYLQANKRCQVPAGPDFATSEEVFAGTPMSALCQVQRRAADTCDYIHLNPFAMSTKRLYSVSGCWMLDASGACKQGEPQE